MVYVSKELRMMKWSVALTSLFFGLVTFAGTAWGNDAKGSDASARTLVDRVAAVVEGDVITLRALETLAERPLAELARYENPKERAARRKAILVQALDSVLSEKMIELEIDSNPDLLTINDQDIDRAIGDVTRMNQIDREQLRQAVEAQGITWSDYRDQLRTQLQKSRLIQFRVQSRVQVTEDDVRRTCVADKFREGQGQVCASHLLLALTDEATQAETIERAKALKVRWKDGESFASLVKAYSNDRSSEDGSLGCFGRGEMVEEFENAAFATRAGTVSDPVVTSFGVHLIWVKSFEEASDSGPTCSEPEVAAKYREPAYQRAMEQEMQRWIEELKERAFIDIRL